MLTLSHEVPTTSLFGENLYTTRVERETAQSVISILWSAFRMAQVYLGKIPGDREGEAWIT